MVMHILAATTNESISPASSSITSGTSGCKADGVIYKEKETEVFIALNLDNLSQEMAQGNGQYLNSLAGLMGCSSTVYSDFASLVQDKYTVLFQSEATDTSDLLSGLKRELKANPKLSTSCTRIS